MKEKYRLERRLAEGGMASVFAATHVRNGCPLAVKILHRELATDSELARRFANEGAAANRVGHPAVVRVFDDDRDEDGTPFLVMELLCGETLDARWRRRGFRLTVTEVAGVLYELLDVLAAAHAKRVFHCDIKPANVFLTRDGEIKVLDFGIARVGDAENGAGARVPIGTPAFMPPEQAVGSVRTVDGRSDLWSVGATAFTLLSGHHVHDRRTPLETMLLCASSSAPPLARAAPDVAPAFAKVIDRALRSDMSDRWPSARAMQAAIADAYREIFKRPLSRRERFDRSFAHTNEPASAHTLSDAARPAASPRSFAPSPTPSLCPPPSPSLCPSPTSSLCPPPTPTLCPPPTPSHCPPPTSSLAPPPLPSESERGEPEGCPNASPSAPRFSPAGSPDGSPVATLRSRTGSSS